MKTWVAWLRGVNVGKAGAGRRAVPMAALREVAADLGWQDAQTYLQSGNLVFRARGGSAALATALEGAIGARWGFCVPVVVTPALALAPLLEACPFGDVADERPQLVHVGFTAAAVSPEVVDALRPYCTAGERVAVQGGALWSDFANGVGRSKLTPAVLDRAVGAPVTSRNLKTLRAVRALAR